jgi:nucleoside-diphosphate-sugar epimerase
MIVHKILVLGATGATGSLVVKKLLSDNARVIAIVRSPDKLIGLVGQHANLEAIRGTALDLNDEEFKHIIAESTAVISCLGHNLTFSGIYGKPRKLVADSVKRVCRSIQEFEPSAPKKLILMNTTGYRNRRTDPKRSFSEKLVIGLVRGLLPPQTDNEAAANYLLEVVGDQCQSIDWVVVRPDSLTDEEATSEIKVVPAVLRSPIFNAGKTSRINAAHFMASLAINQQLISEWRFKSPVIYNADAV